MESTDTARFLGALFSPYSDSDLQGEIRCLPPNRRGRCGPIGFFDLTPQAIGKAAESAGEASGCWDVTVGVLPRIGGGGKRENVFQAAWLWADVDPGEEGYQAAVDRAKAARIPKPHIAIASGAGLHLYWRLWKPVELPGDAARLSFEMTLRRVALAIGGKAPDAHADSAACKCQFLLRVPGTLNHKRGRGVRIVHFAEKPVCEPYDWWRVELPVESGKPPPPRFMQPQRPENPPDSVPRWIDALLSFPTPEGTRHTTALKLTLGAFKQGYTRGAVEMFADHFCALNQFDRMEMARLLYSAERKAG